MKLEEKDKPSTTFKQSLKNSGLSTSKIVGSAVAAILMSIITPRIAGLSGSVLIVGLVSAVSIVVGSFTTATTETVVTTTKKVAPSLIVETTDEKTTEVEEPSGESGEQKSHSKFKPKEFFSKYAYLLMFILVSLLTIGSVAIISTVTGNQNLYSGSVYVRELTEAQKVDLIDEITSNVIQQIEVPPTVVEEVRPEEGLPVEPNQETESEENSQKPENQIEGGSLTLEEQIRALQEEISNLESQINRQETNTNEDLKKEIENLAQRIEKLELQETTPNQEPTPNL